MVLGWLGLGRDDFSLGLVLVLVLTNEGVWDGFERTPGLGVSS